MLLLKNISALKYLSLITILILINSPILHSQSKNNKIEIAIQTTIYRTPKLEIPESLTKKAGLGLKSKFSVGFEGKLMVSYPLSNKFSLTGGLGLGIFGFSLHFNPDSTFTGLSSDFFGGDLASIGHEFSYEHYFSDFGLKYIQQGKFGFEMGAQIHWGYFRKDPAGVIRYTGSSFSNRRTILDLNYIYNSENIFFIGLRLESAIRWEINAHIGFKLSITKIFTAFQPIKNANLTVFSTTEIFTVLVSQRYSPIGIGFYFYYQF